MPAKTRINITVDKETMRLADRLARQRKMSRSAILREGVRALMENHQRELDEAACRKRQQQAVETMNRLAHEAGNWPAVEILHAWRYRLAKGGK